MTPGDAVEWAEQLLLTVTSTRMLHNSARVMWLEWHDQMCSLYSDGKPEEVNPTSVRLLAGYVDRLLPVALPDMMKSMDEEDKSGVPDRTELSKAFSLELKTSSKTGPLTHNTDEQIEYQTTIWRL